MATYREKLRDPRWQRKRLEMLSAAEFSCESCCDSTTTLHVHHRRYIKGRDPWEYERHELSVLCEACHATEHEARADIESLFATACPLVMDYRSAVALIAGWFSASLPEWDQSARELADALGEKWEPRVFRCGVNASREFRELRAKDYQHISFEEWWAQTEGDQCHS